MSLAQSIFLGENEIRKRLRDLRDTLSGIRRVIPANGKLADIACVIPTDKENEVIIPDWTIKKVYRAVISEDGVVRYIWETPTLPGGPLMADYIISLDRLLVPSDGGYVWEIDAKTGNILNTISGLGSLWSITSIQEQPRTALVTIMNRHILAMLDLDAETITPIFGTDGTSGDTTTLLNNPTDVEYFLGQDNVIDYYLIADRNNNRILQVDATNKSVSSIIMFSRILGLTAMRDPVFESFNSRRGQSINFHTAYVRRQFIPTGVVKSQFLDRATSFIPIQGADKPIWSSSNTIWIANGELAFEIDLRYFKEHPKQQSFDRIVWNYSLSAGATYPPSGQQYASVINGLYIDEITIEVFSTASATGYIDIPEMRIWSNWDALEVQPNFSWIEYDSFPISANKITPYFLRNPPNIFRVRVVMGGSSGTISIYAKSNIR